MQGMDMLRAFLFDVCSCRGDWKMSSYVNDAITNIREKVGDKKVLCALSGGVDSSVAAVMPVKSLVLLLSPPVFRS